MDVVQDVKTIEAEIGGRVGDAVAGAKTRSAGFGTSVKDKARRLFGKAESAAGGLSMTVIAIIAVLAVAALASPIALWSSYHAGKDRQAALDQAADARAVAHLAEVEAVAARESARLARVDADDRAEIARLKKVSTKLPPKTRYCPPAIYDVIHGLGGYTLVPPHQESLP